MGCAGDGDTDIGWVPDSARDVEARDATLIPSSHCAGDELAEEAFRYNCCLTKCCKTSRPLCL